MSVNTIAKKKGGNQWHIIVRGSYDSTPTHGRPGSDSNLQPICGQDQWRVSGETVAHRMVLKLNELFDKIEYESDILPAVNGGILSSKTDSICGNCAKMFLDELAEHHEKYGV